MTNKYYYLVYGLTVESDIPLPGAMECPETETPDIRAVLGQIPEFLKGSREKGYGTWTNGFQNAWFYTPGAAEFYVEAGNSVIIAPVEDPNRDLIASLFLSAAMSLLLLQRNEPVLHGSALTCNHQAFLVSGESGAGKSTVSFELMKKPYGFLADDTVRIHKVDGTFLAEPSYPQQKICRDLAERLGLKPEKLRYIDEDRDKFARMCPDRYVQTPLPLKLVVILRKDPRASEVTCRQLTGGEYLDAMVRSFYLAGTYQDSTGFPAELMMQVIALSSQIRLYAVTRPAEGNTVAAVTEQIEALVRENLGE